MGTNMLSCGFAAEIHTHIHFRLASMPHYIKCQKTPRTTNSTPSLTSSLNPKPPPLIYNSPSITAGNRYPPNRATALHCNDRHTRACGIKPWVKWSTAIGHDYRHLWSWLRLRGGVFRWGNVVSWKMSGWLVVDGRGGFWRWWCEGVWRVYDIWMVAMPQTKWIKVCRYVWFCGRAADLRCNYDVSTLNNRLSLQQWYPWQPVRKFLENSYQNSWCISANCISCISVFPTIFNATKCSKSLIIFIQVNLARPPQAESVDDDAYDVIITSSPR